MDMIMCAERAVTEDAVPYCSDLIHKNNDISFKMLSLLNKEKNLHSCSGLCTSDAILM